MYFWTLNSIMFPEFLYCPHVSRCTRLRESSSLHICVTGGLQEVDWTCNKQWVTHMRVNVLCQLLVTAQSIILSEVHGVYSTINVPRKFINSSDALCYMCGELTFKFWRWCFTPVIKKCYKHYFNCKVGDQHKSWVPHFCCVTCVRLLAAWAKGSYCMPFAIPMGREPTHHVSDCCFCVTSMIGVTAKSKHTVQYPTLPPAMRPVPHSVELPVPKLPTNLTLSDI
jgi:hypothetical protein